MLMDGELHGGRQVKVLGVALLYIEREESRLGNGEAGRIRLQSCSLLSCICKSQSAVR